MQFVTLRVTQRFCDFRWIGVRLKLPFCLSATHFEGPKRARPLAQVSGSTSSGPSRSKSVSVAAATTEPMG
ncbi:hypothetical protein BKM09_022885 [Pseudomonas amygdali pv. morsprunorum]|nr:hypothetical protein BKM19_010520 [Pseudomonas amygdali pv. morsprunorum]POP92190.1 hypothetical protein CXB39_16905 [Pseudomonas amygdali pv. morsprunorum]POY81255.1 hypothetical protein BKM09_022885 [Pseudomonas amygdali pv. morsprunorum]